MSGTRTIVLNEQQLAVLDRVLELAIVVVVAYIVANYVRDLLRTTSIDPTTQVLGQIVAFFLVMFIFYKLITIRVKKEL